MNAMRRPSTTAMMMGPVSRDLACTPMNTRLSIARTAAATTVSLASQPPPSEGGGDDQPDHANEFEDAQGRPRLPRQRIKGPGVLADRVEHEDLHDAGRSVQERGEHLQDPQQNVHRVLPFGFRVGVRRCGAWGERVGGAHRAIHILGPAGVTLIPRGTLYRTRLSLSPRRDAP